MKYMTQSCGTVLVVASLLFGSGDAFVAKHAISPYKRVATTDRSRMLLSTKSTTTPSSSSSSLSSREEEIMLQKKKLLGLLGPKTFKDPVLADPITKEAIQITSSTATLGSGSVPSSITFKIQSPSNTFKGTSDTYLDLLEPIDESDKKNLDGKSSSSSPMATILKQAIPYIPPPLRGVLSSDDEEIIPMRDLFTSPAVSFAYERGWRQNFNTAGFPGPDMEATMANEYFAPAIAKAAADGSKSVLVDMSCATGLFTRRFALSEKYDRVIGCDYSPSMLAEARRRIVADPKLSALTSGRTTSQTKTKTTSLDLVRLDVGSIPMQDGTVDCLHAGAAMHCWPDLNAACSEIYRVLKPNGGRYFATTFLSQYFATLSSMDGQANSSPSQQAFQYFESIDTLRNLLVGGGFDRDKVLIEVLGRACVVIRAEK